MNNISVKLLLPVLAVLLGSCIRDHIQDCPPLRVTLTVKDKNYFNIDDAVKLGLAERKDENLPFREYVQTLYYRVTDKEGRIVAEQKTMPVTNDAMTEEIVLPVSLPFLATIALFVAVGQWNSWLDSAYYVRDANLRTLSYMMMTTINQSTASSANSISAGQISSSNTTTSFTIQATAMVISMVPIIIVYPFLQKYFVQGMMLGAVKE